MELGEGGYYASGVVERSREPKQTLSHMTTSFYHYAGIPEILSGGLVVVLFISALSPYLANTDWGMFKVPQLPGGITRVLRWIAPLLLVLAILGFVPMIRPEPQEQPDGPSANSIAWSKIMSDTLLIKELDGAFRVYRELDSGIEKNDKGVPRCHRFLGVSKISSVNVAEMKLRISPKTRDQGTPSLIAFIVRERDGYFNLVDIDATSGMPYDTRKTRNEKIWIIQNYAKGERIKIVLFVIPDSDEQMASYNFLNGEDIVNVQFEKN